MSTNLTAVLQQLLQNTSNLKVLRERMTPDATYVSLNFNNPELKKVMPWTGTHKGPQELFDVFAAIQRYWKTLDFKVTDTIEQGSRVGFFGSFTYKSNVTGKEITSPFSLLARFEGDKVAYVQFLEDSYGTAGSFKTGVSATFALVTGVKSQGYIPLLGHFSRVNSGSLLLTPPNGWATANAGYFLVLSTVLGANRFPAILVNWLGKVTFAA